MPQNARCNGKNRSYPIWLHLTSSIKGSSKMKYARNSHTKSVSLKERLSFKKKMQVLRLKISFLKAVSKAFQDCLKNVLNRRIFCWAKNIIFHWINSCIYLSKLPTFCNEHIKGMKCKSDFLNAQYFFIFIFIGRILSVQ